MMIRVQQIVGLKVMNKLDKYSSFQDFTEDWEQGDWSVIFRI